jgi:hypothetical protein
VMPAAGFASAGITRATASVPGRLIARSCHAASGMGFPSIHFTVTVTVNTKSSPRWDVHLPGVRATGCSTQPR